ncbi:hypothetical protein TNCV_1319821 [Trichonephila clavipes]|nr:hypothetical protein TNCV_1319821 [Trichonephila clavipes]
MNMKRKEKFQMLPKEHQPKILTHKCTTRFSLPCQKDSRKKKLNLLFVDYRRCHEFEPSTTKDPPCRESTKSKEYCNVTTPNTNSGRRLCWTRHPHVYLAAAAQPLFDPEESNPVDRKMRERCFELTRER